MAKKPSWPMKKDGADKKMGDEKGKKEAEKKGKKHEKK